MVYRYRVVAPVFFVAATSVFRTTEVALVAAMHAYGP